MFDTVTPENQIIFGMALLMLLLRRPLFSLVWIMLCLFFVPSNVHDLQISAFFLVGAYTFTLFRKVG